MSWNDRPKAGEVWRRVQRGHKETRTVMDRNLGGDVFYISGRNTRHAIEERCTEATWLKWQASAKEIKKP